MGITRVADVSNQVQKFWAPLFMKELRAKLLLGGLVNKEYEGEIKQKGDTVYVSQINAPTGELKTIGTDDNSFEAEALSTSRISIAANKRAVAAYEFEDLVTLQSQLEAEDSAIRDALLFAAMKQINTYLYSLVSPSASAPDHIIASAASSDLASADLITMRNLAANAKWLKNKPWYMLLSPDFYGDLLAKTVITSGDFAADQPAVSGNIAQSRFGWNIMEDDSLSGDYALAFHPDFLHLVMQTMPTFKVSDQHANKRFGYVISVDAIFGAALGIAGNVKHIKMTGT